MTPINHPPGTLAIKVRAEGVEEKCDYTRHHYRCVKGWLRDSPANGCVDGFRVPLGFILGTEQCPHCHGSGVRKVTLEGWVSFLVDPHVDGYDLKTGEIEVSLCVTTDDNQYYISKEDTEEFIASDGTIMNSPYSFKKIHDRIVAMLHDGTCPDEIRKQLKVVDK